jgi:hypothetical protein
MAAKKKKKSTKKVIKPRLKTGPPKKILTDEMEEKFLKAIRLGCPIRDACGCAGFSDSWFYRTQQALEGKANKDSRQWAAFTAAIKKAEGEATARWLAVIERAAHEGSWQAAAWKLERRREMFVPRVRQEVTGKDGEAIRIEGEAGSARAVIDAAISRHVGSVSKGNGVSKSDSEATH